MKAALEWLAIGVTVGSAVSAAGVAVLVKPNTRVWLVGLVVAAGEGVVGMLLLLCAGFAPS